LILSPATPRRFASASQSEALHNETSAAFCLRYASTKYDAKAGANLRDIDQKNSFSDPPKCT
jgi:hypothetical protein